MHGLSSKKIWMVSLSMLLNETSRMPGSPPPGIFYFKISLIFIKMYFEYFIITGI